MALLAPVFDPHVSASHAATVVTLGGLGGIFYWLVIFPVDAVKSVMQTDDIRKPHRKFPTMASAVQVLFLISHSVPQVSPACVNNAPPRPLCRC